MVRGIRIFFLMKTEEFVDKKELNSLFFFKKKENGIKER
jgi:hypothetical protein